CFGFTVVECSEEYMAKRRETEKERTKIRVYIGESIQRWRELRRQKGFQSDVHVAKFLLDRWQAVLTLPFRVAVWRDEAREGRKDTSKP
uniref:Uncharacterized protein n=1 Tax=Dicentrarchus labrax TaxID=13489 RepID=A0A8C4DXR2_DICLA